MEAGGLYCLCKPPLNRGRTTDQVSTDQVFQTRDTVLYLFQLTIGSPGFVAALTLDALQGGKPDVEIRLVVLSCAQEDDRSERRYE